MNLYEFHRGTSSLLVSIPHSGTELPEALAHRLTVVGRGVPDTDWHVDKLYDFAPELGVAWIEALFPRSYLEPVERVTEIDLALIEDGWDGPVATDPFALAKVRLGKGLVWRLTDEGEAIYDRKLTAAEVRSRIERCWRPYHQAVAAAIEAAHARHGYSIHLNCHSMPSVAGPYATEHPGVAHAEFVLGDRDGTTCDAEFTALVAGELRKMGYDVKINDPYKGVELVRAFSDPKAGRHSLQVEVNRRLYMDEKTRERSSTFAGLKSDLDRLLAELARFAAERSHDCHDHAHDHGHGHGHPHHHDHSHDDHSHRH